VDLASVVEELKSMANPANVEGMAKFAISSQDTLGISIYDLRRLAARIGRDHGLALELWKTGIHEAKILASYIENPLRVTTAQMDAWAADFDSWDVCDQVCDLFAKTPFVHTKIAEWSERPEEFVKRAAFAMICELAWYDKDASDESMAGYFPLIICESTDERNFVKKAVNWALRNIGKRNRALNAQAIAVAERLAASESRSARWIGRDALRELKSEKVQQRLSS
jgi:3-methyladenine DNA glycosylase AlkD